MRAAIVAGTLLLAACDSGGGSSSGATPTPSGPNTAPSFTSAATASVAENATLAYQAAATDAQSNAITYSIAGGADAGRFAITAAGALSFAAAPNFELPADANGDNVYEVQLGASDGSLSSALNLQITVTDSREGIAVRRVATGFDQPIDVAAVPYDPSQILVAEKTGGIWYVNIATGAKVLAMRVDGLSTDGERGLLGIAPKPSFQGSKQILTLNTAVDGAVEIREYVLALGSYELVLSTPHSANNNHNGGWIAFGPDNYLYAAIGDGGGAGDPANNAQNVNVRLGKILRLNINTLVAPAGAPPPSPAKTNPFYNGGGDPWIFAYGLRNPFRASFDGDRLIIADVGQNALEEINIVRTDQPGLNFGWRFLEGTQPFTGTAPSGLTAPVSQYEHGSGPKQGGSIIGGYVYRGPITSLQGSYVFGDFVSGNIWTLPAASLTQGSLFPSGSYERRNIDFTPDVGQINQLVSFGVDVSGNLYIVDLDGDIFVVEPG